MSQLAGYLLWRTYPVSALSTNLTAALDSGELHLIASCTAACGYEQTVVGFAGRYCPYCGQDVEHAIDESRLS